MSDPKNAADQNDPATPLEELNPVTAEGTDEDTPEPPKEWGANGQGEDAEDPEAEEVPQSGD